MNFLDVEAIKLDGGKMDPVITAQIATILKHQVRQLIVNDLGLTRETIRSETSEFVRSTVTTHLNANLNSTIESVVRSFLANHQKLQQTIDLEVKRQVAQIVHDKLKISLN